MTSCRQFRRLVLLSFPLLIVSSTWSLMSPPVAAGRPVVDPALSQVEGQVVDTEGKSVAGARVFAARETSAGEQEPLDVRDATTNSSGHFQLEWPDLVEGRGSPVLWVHHPNYGLNRASALSARIGIPLRVVLHPTVQRTGASLELLGPGGEPVSEARIIPTRWFEGGDQAESGQFRAIPRVVGELIATRTNSRGHADLEAVAALRLSEVVIRSRFGSQVESWDDGLVARDRTIHLRPVGRVRGRIKSAGPGAAARLPVRITSLALDRVIGRASAVTDPEGWFEAESVAAGSVVIAVEATPGAKELPDRVERGTLEVGKTLKVEFSLRPGVALRGVMRERGSQTPVPGAWVEVRGQDDEMPRHARTDEQGRFSTIVPAGNVTLKVESVPSPYLVPAAPAREPRVAVPDGIPDFEWPIIELDRGSMIRGRVATRNGQPVAAGIAVEAKWSRRGDGRTHENQLARGWTSRNGQFEVGPVDWDVEVTLTALRPEQGWGEVTRVVASKGTSSVDLILPEVAVGFEPAGRVIDASGRPVAHALVQFRVLDPGLGARGLIFGRRMVGNGLDSVVTDAQGHYRASGRLDGRYRYLASAEAAGCEAGQTRGFLPTPGPGTTLKFPDLVMTRHPGRPVVVGRVVDTDRRPIPGVVVRDQFKVAATTDASGRFRLEEASGQRPSFLFAEREGYRFVGRSLDATAVAGDPIPEFVLVRNEEAAAGPPVLRQPSAWPSRLIIAVLVRSLVINPMVERILACRDGVMTSMLMERLVEHEPQRVLDWLEEGLISEPRAVDGLRSIAARRLASRQFGAAEPVLSAIFDLGRRHRATLDALGVARDLDRAQKLLRIERVERDVDTLADPAQRAVLLARVADAWLDVDDLPRAMHCLDRAQTLAGALPGATSGTRAWCAIIEPLGRVNPDLARQRLSEIQDPVDADRCRLALASRWANADPEGSVRIFRQVRDSKVKIRAVPELVYHLAQVNPTLARSLQESIVRSHPAESAYALGMLAAGLAPLDRAAASTALREAYAGLEALASSSPEHLADHPVEPVLIAASLLPVVEVVAPGLLAEFFWKTVSLHTPRPLRGHRSDVVLAVLLDPYDPMAARLICDHSRIKRHTIAPRDLPILLLSATQLAPDLALQWAEHWQESAFPDQTASVLSAESNFELISGWAFTDQGRRDHIAQRYLGLWTPPLGSARTAIDRRPIPE